MAIDAVAARYGTRPSQLLQGTWADLQLDYAVLAAARAHRQQLQDEQQRAPTQFASVRHLARKRV
jgi:hypothetical protein